MEYDGVWCDVVLCQCDVIVWNGVWCVVGVLMAKICCVERESVECVKRFREIWTDFRVKLSRSLVVWRFRKITKRMEENHQIRKHKPNVKMLTFLPHKTELQSLNLRLSIFLSGRLSKIIFDYWQCVSMIHPKRVWPLTLSTLDRRPFDLWSFQNDTKKWNRLEIHYQTVRDKVTQRVFLTRTSLSGVA